MTRSDQIRTPVRWLLFGLFVLAGLTVLGGSGWWLRVTLQQSASISSAIGALTLLAAPALYLSAHVLRAARLAVIIGNERVGLRAIFHVHFLAAGVGLLLPFKLGEGYRVAEVARLLRAPIRAVLLVWSERVLDLIALALAALAGMWYRRSIFDNLAGGLLVTLAVIAGTFILFFVVPENIESLKLFIIRRYNTAWALRVLRALNAIHSVVAKAPALLSRRLITLITLTLLIWALEVAAIALILPAAVSLADSAMVGVAFFFSRIVPGAQTDLAAIATDVNPGAVNPTAAAAISATYPAIVYLPLLIVSLALFAGSLVARWREAVGAAFGIRALGPSAVPALGDPR